MKRYHNVVKILAQAIEANNRKEIIKSTTGQFIHWNQEIRLPDNILDPRQNDHNVVQLSGLKREAKETLVRGSHKHHVGV
jgi:hypothetical protein